MPMFQVDNGRAVVVQPVRPAAQAFGETSRALAEHLDALFGEHLLPVRVRSGVEDEPYLLAVDASGHPLVVEVVALLDESTLVRALRHTGRVARMSLGELGARHPAGSERFAADLARFRDAVPIATLGASAPGARLLLVCSEYADGMEDVIEALTQPGRGVDVLQIGVLESADGPPLLDVSPARRAASPSVPAGPAVPHPMPEAAVPAPAAQDRTTAPRRRAEASPTRGAHAGPVSADEPQAAVDEAPAVPEEAPIVVPESPTRASARARPVDRVPGASPVHPDRAPVHAPARAAAACLDVPPSPPTHSPAVIAPQVVPAMTVGGVPTRVSTGVRLASPAARTSNGGSTHAQRHDADAVEVATADEAPDAAAGPRDAGHLGVEAPRRAPAYALDARLAALASARGGAVVLVWWRQRRGILHEALLHEDGSIELADGTRAMDPSAAAEIASGAHVPVDGWQVWRLETHDGVPLADAVAPA